METHAFFSILYGPIRSMATSCLGTSCACFRARSS